MKIKARDIRALPLLELKEKRLNLEEELFNLRFQATMGQLSNPLRIRTIKKELACTNTVLTDKKRTNKTIAPQETKN